MRTLFRVPPLSSLSIFKPSKLYKWSRSEVGSKKPHLHTVALKVFSIALKYQIRIEPEWIPRELNEEADFLSCIVDQDDSKLNPLIFSCLDALWGPHTVDRFADCYNTQLPCFNSRFWCPDTEAVDTFTVNWKGEIIGSAPQCTLSPDASVMLKHVQPQVL